MNKNRMVVGASGSSNKNIKQNIGFKRFVSMNILAILICVSIIAMLVIFMLRLDGSISLIQYINSVEDNIEKQLLTLSGTKSEDSSMETDILAEYDDVDSDYLEDNSDANLYDDTNSEESYDSETVDDRNNPDEGLTEIDDLGDSAIETADSGNTDSIDETIEKVVPAKVQYEFYDPISVNSRYYRDVGKIPHTMNADFSSVDETYFDDSCWIGDSRCLGVFDYSGWNNADFYCDNGFCAYSFSKGKSVKLQGTGSKFTVEEAVSQKNYGKIYIMMGINDCGYGTTATFREEYKNMVDVIMEAQPEAIVYLVGNMHISRKAEQAADPEVYTNRNINAKNAAIASCADGINSFYIDFNDLFIDDEGYLIEEKTFDGYHLYAAGYMEMIDYFKEHAIVR